MVAKQSFAAVRSQAELGNEVNRNWWAVPTLLSLLLLQVFVRNLRERPDGDVAIEDFGPFGLDLDLALGEGDFLAVHDLAGAGQDHVDLAVDDMHAGRADRHQLDRIPLAGGLL